MNKYTMIVNTKVAGKYEKVGTVEIFYPLLSDLGFAVEPKSLDDDSGLPTYNNEAEQFAFDSVFNAVKADARNKLVSKTADLKDGAKISTTLAELTAPAERDGSALVNIREMLVAFKAYLTTTDKASNVQAAILTLASRKQNLAMQPTANKGKFLVHLENFEATLTDAQSEQFARSIDGLATACEDSFDLDDM